MDMAAVLDSTNFSPGRSDKDANVMMSSSEDTVIGTHVSMDENREPVPEDDGVVEQKSKYVAPNGLAFNSVDEVLQALSAALEVNEHLRQQVEEKGSLALALGDKLEACESRYTTLLARVQELEREHADAGSSETEVSASSRMQSLVVQANRRPTKGFWESELVSKKRKALLDKGAQEGWLMSSNELQIGAAIGAGTFGQTFEAVWRGTRVAVKAAQTPQTSSEAINVLREIECFSSVKHPNVLPFLGACLSDEDRCLLVTEFMSGGNLKDWIHGPPNSRRPYRKLSERLRMALQVAQGMAGLEGENPPIVHRDLKPSNVMLDAAGAARVADMNLSLRLHDDTLANLTGETGTYLYMSPEMMRHEMYTTKTDVWSFGVMLTELCNQTMPYSNLFLTPLQVAIGVADRSLRPPLEATDIPMPIKHLIDACLSQDPFQRPNFVTIVSQIKPILATVLTAEARADAAPSLFNRFQGIWQGVGNAVGGSGGAGAVSHGGGGLGSRTGSVPATASPQTPPVGVRRSNSHGIGASPGQHGVPPIGGGGSRGGSVGGPSMSAAGGAPASTAGSMGGMGNLPPPGQRPSIAGGLPGGGGYGGLGGGGATGGARAAAGAAAASASAMLSGFLNRTRPSPRR